MTIIGIVWGLILLAINYYEARFVQVPQLTQRVEKLETDLNMTREARDNLKHSIGETGVLRRAMALVPGDIRQITRDVYISYDESTPSTITQTDDQTFQWKVRIKQEENSRYSGFIGHRLWGFPNVMADDCINSEQKKLREQCRRVSETGDFTMLRTALFREV